eukprot:TRINITY_DN17406_c0_g1_i1.p1 TRINITY_DN17406_c0_g1~~TRINITY_DN17406_c0_g1_i1.p1  ORF type:complete len:491 (-),score=76.37 TRINITY_DN17406_c0_g1_i1:36-1508(-)
MADLQENESQNPATQQSTMITVTDRLNGAFNRASTNLKETIKPYIDHVTLLLADPRSQKALRWISVGLFGLFLVHQNLRDPSRLPPTAGLFLILFSAYLLSESRPDISFRPLLGGIILQLLLSLLFFKTWLGVFVFTRLNIIFNAFIQSSNAGALFVYGPTYKDHYIAFSVLTCVIFFSAMTSLLYHLRILPVIIRFLGFIFQRTLQTTGPESMAAAGNIFLGQTEAPLLLRPLLPTISRSELFLIMTSGFATVAGSMLGVYLSLGISASYVMIASGMNPVSAVIISKLMCPEALLPMTVQDEPTRQQLDGGIEEMKWSNMWEAISDGATTGAKLAINIGACLLVFVALMFLANVFLEFLGDLVGISGLSFEFITGFLLRPVAWLLGVPWEETLTTGQLLALKIFLTELIAYVHFVESIANGVYASERSVMIITFALCSFSNFASVGIQIGGLGSLVPARRGLVSQLVIRALIGGNLACWLTTTFVAIVA